MHRRAFAILALSAGLLFASPVAAWSPPDVGQACRGGRGSGPALSAISGNYLGGRRVRDGIADWKSFQGCFRSADQCERWLAGKARAYPLSPGRAACVRVTLR